MDDALLDIDAARRLVADPPNRHAAFHLQQAAEKLVKAVRLHRALYPTAEHQIAALLIELPADDPWRAKLGALGPLSDYATSFRYPSGFGKAKPGPSVGEVRNWITKIEALITEARGALC